MKTTHSASQLGNSLRNEINFLLEGHCEPQDSCRELLPPVKSEGFAGKPSRQKEKKKAAAIVRQPGRTQEATRVVRRILNRERNRRGDTAEGTQTASGRRKTQTTGKSSFTQRESLFSQPLGRPQGSDWVNPAKLVFNQLENIRTWEKKNQPCK